MKGFISCLAPIFFSPLLEVALTTTHAQASLSQSSQNPLQFKVNWLFFWHLASAVFFLCIIWKQYSLNSTQVQKVTAYMKWVNLNKRKEQINLFKRLSFWTADRCYRLREFFPQHCVTCCLNITYVLRINPDLVKALQCILLQISFPSHVTKKSKFIRIISTQVSNCSAVSFALKCHWWGAGESEMKQHSDFDCFYPGSIWCLSLQARKEKKRIPLKSKCEDTRTGLPCQSWSHLLGVVYLIKLRAFVRFTWQFGFLCEKSLTAGGKKQKERKSLLRFSKAFGCQTGKQFVELNPELHIWFCFINPTVEYSMPALHSSDEWIILMYNQFSSWKCSILNAHRVLIIFEIMSVCDGRQ